MAVAGRATPVGDDGAGDGTSRARAGDSIRRRFHVTPIHRAHDEFVPSAALRVGYNHRSARFG
jgi:hypothetical protein